jgi:hypothetical protein
VRGYQARESRSRSPSGRRGRERKPAAERDKQGDDEPRPPSSTKLGPENQPERAQAFTSYEQV